VKGIFGNEEAKGWSLSLLLLCEWQACRRALCLFLLHRQGLLWQLKLAPIQNEINSLACIGTACYSLDALHFSGQWTSCIFAAATTLPAPILPFRRFIAAHLSSVTAPSPPSFPPCPALLVVVLPSLSSRLTPSLRPESPFSRSIPYPSHSLRQPARQPDNGNTRASSLDPAISHSCTDSFAFRSPEHSPLYVLPFSPHAFRLRLACRMVPGDLHSLLAITPT
jgi:hypothetical protein